LRGVTSFVRVLGLQERCYKSLLHCFHSKAFPPAAAGTKPISNSGVKLPIRVSKAPTVVRSRPDGQWCLLQPCRNPFESVAPDAVTRSLVKLHILKGMQIYPV
jgi:hypothetical protein